MKIDDGSNMFQWSLRYFDKKMGLAGIGNIMIIPRVFGDSFKLMSVYVLASFVHCTFLVSHFPGMNEAQHLQWALYGRGRVKSKVSVPGLESKLILTLPPCYIHLCKWKCCWSSVFFRIVLGVWRISNVQESSLNKLKSESSIISSGSKRCWPLGFAAARDPCLPKVGCSVDPLSPLELGNCKKKLGWLRLKFVVFTCDHQLTAFDQDETINMKRRLSAANANSEGLSGASQSDVSSSCRGVKWWNPSIQETEWSVISAHQDHLKFIPTSDQCPPFTSAGAILEKNRTALLVALCLHFWGLLSNSSWRIWNQTAPGRRSCRYACTRPGQHDESWSHGGRKFSNALQVQDMLRQAQRSPCPHYTYFQWLTRSSATFGFQGTHYYDYETLWNNVLSIRLHAIVAFATRIDKMPENSSNTHHASNSWTTSLATSQRVPTPATFSSRQPSGSGE